MKVNILLECKNHNQPGRKYILTIPATLSSDDNQLETKGMFLVVDSIVGMRVDCCCE